MSELIALKEELQKGKSNEGTTKQKEPFDKVLREMLSQCSEADSRLIQERNEAQGRQDMLISKMERQQLEFCEERRMAQERQDMLVDRMEKKQVSVTTMSMKTTKRCYPPVLHPLVINDSAQ